MPICYYVILLLTLSSLFFFNDTATTEIYTLSLHDALPISQRRPVFVGRREGELRADVGPQAQHAREHRVRSEEHTSELQSRGHLVCRLLLEKKKKQNQPKLNTRTQ